MFFVTKLFAFQLQKFCFRDYGSATFPKAPHHTNPRCSRVWRMPVMRGKWFHDPLLNVALGCSL